MHLLSFSNQSLGSPADFIVPLYHFRDAQKSHEIACSYLYSVLIERKQEQTKCSEGFRSSGLLGKINSIAIEVERNALEGNTHCFSEVGDQFLNWYDTQDRHIQL